MKYFQSSPNAFLVQDNHYQTISENMRSKIVTGNLMTKFQDKFDVFWNDLELKFKGDDKLITMIISVLQYENPLNFFENSLIKEQVISKSIVLIQEGAVEMFCKGCDKQAMLIYEDGSCLGEISLMCGIRNQFKFLVK